MTPRIARWLVRLYPRDWRERYGNELEALLQESHGGISTLINVLGSALRERVLAAITVEVLLNHYPTSVLSLSRKPSAFVPMAMSLIALAVVLAHVLSNGVVREADEGPAAHLWQLLIAGQLPISTYFLIRWLPRVPRHTLLVLALQIGAALAAMAPVYLLGL